VTFEINTYTVTAAVASGQGTALPLTQQVDHGEDATPITITPASGWHISSITDNGAPVEVADPSGMEYTVVGVTGDHEVLVTFEEDMQPSTTWYLAEGCTEGDFETFVLVQNPGDAEVSVDLTFMTSQGERPGPQDFPLKAGSRHTFKLNDYLVDWEVSTRVEASGPVVCERAMYGNGRTWAHDSVGVTEPAKVWYLAEGCTEGDFETFVLVANPNPSPANVSLTLMTEGGQEEPAALQDVLIPPNSRHTFKLNDYLVDWEVSTKVEASGPVVCERAMYGNGRTWAHDSIVYSPRPLIGVTSK